MDYDRLTGPQRKALREALMDLFRSVQSFDIFLDENGYTPLSHGPGGTFAFQVYHLIGELMRLGDLPGFVARLRAEYPSSPALADMDSRLGLLDAASEGQRLVRAKGGLERLVRDSGFADLNLWATELMKLGARVCRIRSLERSAVRYGTGFLVGRDLVLTNYHVVEHLINGAAQQTTALEFGAAEGTEGPDRPDSHRLAQDWLVAHRSYSPTDLDPALGPPDPSDLDFALVRLAAPAGDARTPDGVRGWIDLDAADPAPAPGRIVFILQHPEGRSLKQSVGETLPSPSPVRLRYDADTEGGSSGALVVTSDLVPLALHHAGDPSARIRAAYNQGIPLTAIRNALRAGP